MSELPAAYRPVLTLLVLICGAYLLFLLAPILTPFLVAAALAYLCAPLMDRLQAWHLGRTVAAIVVLSGLACSFLALFLVLTPLLQAQTRLFVQQLPGLVDWAGNSLFPWISTTLGVDLAHDQADMLAWLRSHLGELGRLTPVFAQLAQGGLALLGMLAHLVLIPVVLFYLLRDWPRILGHLADWLPTRLRPQVTRFVEEIDGVLSQFARGQIMVMVVMSLFYCLGLWFAGLHYALAVGLVAGMLVFVPYLGMVAGVLLGTLAAFTQFGALAGVLPVWGVFALGQVLEGMVVTPWLVGERVGLHPVAVIFALMAFGQLLGFVGILMAIPAAAISVVALRRLKMQLD